MPAVSVIIPVYNTECYLYQCIDSVISQSFRDWELILVDDGSDDASGDICDEYAGRDERVRVFHKENGGVSSARNLGLEKAKGKWIYFCDSDDELYHYSLEKLVDGTAKDVDLVNAGYNVVGIDDKIQQTVPLHATEVISVERMLQRLVYSQEYIYQGFLFTKLFRNDIIQTNRLRFNIDIFYNEDRLFIVDYLCKCTGRVWFSTECLYKYIIRPQSATQSLEKRDASKLATSIKANILILDELREHNLAKETLSLWKYSAIRSFYQTYESFVLYEKDLSEVMLLKRELVKRTGCMALLSYRVNRMCGSLKTVAYNMLNH